MHTHSPADIAYRARHLTWLLFDVDGVLTDGRLFYGSKGETWKIFDVRDGLGMKLAQREGLKVGILSGRGNEALQVRARELGLDALFMNRGDKSTAFDEFLAEHAVEPAQVAYAGDDLPDLPVLLRCGLSFCPADARPELRERVDVVLETKGGQGAARELCERVLRERGSWDGLVAQYLA
jgi:3-deoxy-D-manno-octulosonate 8-phosphate phosphatase (KDO 8-P phosphatase)